MNKLMTFVKDFVFSFIIKSNNCRLVCKSSDCLLRSHSQAVRKKKKKKREIRLIVRSKTINNLPIYTTHKSTISLLTCIL